MTSWRVSLWLPPPRGPRPAEHKGFGAERSGQRRRLSHPLTNFPRRGGSSDGAIARSRPVRTGFHRAFPARTPAPRARCSRVHVARRRSAKSSEPDDGSMDRPPRRQVGEPRPIASRRAGRSLAALARPTAAPGCATARTNGSRTTCQGVLIARANPLGTNFGARTNYEASPEVLVRGPIKDSIELLALSIVSFLLRLTGRACRCRPGAAALAGSGSVRRRERPGPASLDCSRLAPLLAGPRRAAAACAAPGTTSAPPRSAPRALRSQCQRLHFAQNQHLPLIRWRRGQAHWTRAEQHDQNTPSPRCSAPRSVSRSRYTSVSSQFLADFKSNRLPDRNPGN